VAERPTLHRIFIRVCRRHPFRLAFADASRPKVSRLKALTGTIALGRALRKHWKGQHHVGVLLPSTVAGALVNLAAAMGGRTVVNLNFTAGRAGMESAAQQAGLKSIVTSRRFLKKAELELPEGVDPIWLEDVAKEIGFGSRLLAMTYALFAPKRWLEKTCGAARRPRSEDPVTVIFSSGSTGEPKGIVLTHANIDANVEAAASVFNFESDDRILGILPLFHSFGYMATLWLAANHGLAVVFHPNPMEAAEIGKLVEKYDVTFLLATPTFFQLYLRRCTPEQFKSLRTVIAGAEKLSGRLAKAFEEKFGTVLREGYGMTECSPVVALLTADDVQPKRKAPMGSVGRPLPGVSVRIVDPDKGHDLPTGQAGMLLVKGPNVMKGYLGRDELTQAALRDGWYVSGDIALVNDEGYITITDRLARFSKIGGEMVPHGRVEEALHIAAGTEEQVFAVTAVRDERKGEQLAVLHTTDPATIDGLLEKLAGQGLPNLFIPRASHFIQVDELPVLGTGKLDLRGIKEVATRSLQREA